MFWMFMNIKNTNKKWSLLHRIFCKIVHECVHEQVMNVHMNVHEYSWMFMNIHECSWTFMNIQIHQKFLRMLEISEIMTILVFQWYVHEQSWIFMNTWGQFMNVHEYSRTFMNVHEQFMNSSWTFMNSVRNLILYQFGLLQITFGSPKDCCICQS